MGLIQPALKFMERLLCTSVSPFPLAGACWLLRWFLSLSFWLAFKSFQNIMPLVPYTRTDRKRERQDKNPFAMCGGQGTWNGSRGSSVGNKLGLLSQAALDRHPSLLQLLPLYCNCQYQHSQELCCKSPLSTFIKHYMLSFWGPWTQSHT